jgi:hypothetical protein
MLGDVTFLLGSSLLAQYSLPPNLLPPTNTRHVKTWSENSAASRLEINYFRNSSIYTVGGLTE